MLSDWLLLFLDHSGDKQCRSLHPHTVDKKARDRVCPANGSTATCEGAFASATNRDGRVTYYSSDLGRKMGRSCSNHTQSLLTSSRRRPLQETSIFSPQHSHANLAQGAVSVDKSPERRAHTSTGMDSVTLLESV
jgi:hypothetical protein